MSTIRCTTLVETIGDRALVRLPAEASSALPSRGQVAVEASLNGQSLGIVLEPDGRRGHWLPLDDHVLRSFALADGDTVKLQVEPSKEWPEPELPEDFAAALTEASDLAEVWVDITPMARWEWVRWVKATKNAQTRQRRVEVSISKLRAGKRRPCCFDLSSCTDPELSASGKLLDPS